MNTRSAARDEEKEPADVAITADAQLSALPSRVHLSRGSMEILVDGDEDELLRLNVGGCSFSLLTTEIVKNCRAGFLQAFALQSHEERLDEPQLDIYLPQSQEYYFARSADYFAAVYNFCCNGRLHSPLPRHACKQAFFDELAFWGVPKGEMRHCGACSKQVAASAGLALDGSEGSLMDTLVALQTAKIEFEGKCCPNLRHALWRMLEGQPSNLYEHVYSIVSMGAIILSTVVFVMASMPTFQVMAAENGTTKNPVEIGKATTTANRPIRELEAIELICIIWFSAEYALKMAVAPHKRDAFLDKMNLVDFVSIVPFFIELAFELLTGTADNNVGDIKQAFITIRLLRVMRIFKLFRHSVGLRVFARCLQESVKQLYMLTAVFAIAIIFFSAVIYNVEKDVADSKFVSIPEAAWWTLVTMTTVGYGDIYPVTVAGKVVGMVAILSGVLVLALPITVIIDSFMRVSNEKEPRPRAGALSHMMMGLRQANHPLMAAMIGRSVRLPAARSRSSTYSNTCQSQLAASSNSSTLNARLV